MILLLVSGLYPMSFSDIDIAKKYLKRIRKETGKPYDALYCEYKSRDLREGFANCKFKTI
jgi:hypothetical protein